MPSYGVARRGSPGSPQQCTVSHRRVPRLMCAHRRSRPGRDLIADEDGDALPARGDHRRVEAVDRTASRCDVGQGQRGAPETICSVP